MKLQEQVCTLEQAKRLKELGVSQESIFSYFKAPHHAGICITDMSTRHVWILSGNPYDQEDIELTAAYTVAELGAMIGRGTNAAALLYDAVQDHMNRSHSFTICYSPSFLANCIISLLNTGRLTAAEVNERLNK